MSSTPRNAIGWLEGRPDFRALTDRAAQLLALQADLRRCAPARSLTALGVDGDTLLVGAAGAAAAAKLRQLEPTLVAHLAARGWAIRRVRFRPMPLGAVAPAPVLTPRADIPQDTLERFAQLADASSSPALKAALTQLLRSRARGAR